MGTFIQIIPTLITASLLVLKQPEEVIGNIIVNANLIHQRPCKMTGRAHRSNCRQGLRELFVMHTEQPLTGFVYVGWNKMIEKIKNQRGRRNIRKEGPR